MADDVALRVSGLTKRYGDLVAVDGLSLEVRRKEILGFLGPNGAGKTTTLRMLCGLLRPDAGTIEIDGRTVSADEMRGLRSIGVAPQEIVVWETLTCFEQLEFVGRMYDLSRADARASADLLLEAFGLLDKKHSLAKTLSGGMRRRLNIALGLAHAPQILLLDEPQAGLDPQSRVLVRDYVRSLASDTTVIVTTHDMEEAEKLSDRVCIIDHGVLLALDTVQGIKNQLGEGDLFEVETDGPPPLVEAIEGLSPRVDGNTLTFTSVNGSEVLPELLQVIRDRGSRVESLRMRKTTLEDVFIRLTGRGLRE